LVNKVYFRLMELLFKFNHLCFSLVSLGGPVYFKSATNNYSWWRRLLSYLWFHPNWFTIMMFICLLLELLINKGQIYFGLYLLCFYPLVRSIIYLLYSFGNSRWVLDCCLSDYISCRWDSVHYPEVFWDYFDDAEFYFGFEFDFTEEQLALISKSKSKIIWQTRKNVSKHVHDSAVFLRVIGKRKFGIVLAASFKSHYSIRWVHTKVILENPVWHSATALFARTYVQKVALLNNSWRHLFSIQKIEAMYPETQAAISSNMFLKIPQNFTEKKKHFIKHIENHTSDHFLELKEKHVLIEPFDPTKHRNLHDVKYPQQEPDIVLDARNTEFNDTTIRFLDQKTNHPGTGKNKILSNISEKRYCTTLNLFLLEYQKVNKNTYEIVTLINSLKTSCNNFAEHQLIWARGLPLFDKIGSVPPIRVPENFSTRNFSPETLKALKTEGFRLQKVSDFLYAKKIPQNQNGTFSDEALALWNDSEIQRILAE
jgi:hypothetical protein